ncbi:MAG: AMP-binding protein, partial [Candidatus Poribacteria bacterium]
MMDKQINEPLQLNEVEAALLSEASVADCVVLARENSNATKKDVLAYIVGRKRLEPSQLKAHLRDRLPPHLLPNAYIPVSSIPLTPDGQVDKQALTDLEVIDSDLVHRWEENLRTLPEVEQVGVVTVEHSENLPPLHLSDLLPRWNRDSKHTNFPDAKQTDWRSGQNSESRKVKQSENQQPAISHGPPLQEVLDAPNTLSEVLQRAAANTPNNGILYIQPDGSEIFQSYSALLADAKRILMGLRKQALKPQDKVIFQLEFNLDFIPAFWACVLGGFVPVPIAIAPSYEPSNGVVSKLHNAWQMLDRPMVLTSERLAPSIRSLSDLLNLENFSVETVEDLRKESAGEVLQASSQDCHDSRSEDLALLMLTSGSTGMPKGVMLTHHNIIARSAGTAQMHSFSSEDISLNWFPLDHVVGLVMFHIRDVYLGCQQIHAPSELVLQYPLKWLDWMSRHSVTVTWAPNFAYGLINERAEKISTGKWDLSSIRYI